NGEQHRRDAIGKHERRHQKTHQGWIRDTDIGMKDVVVEQHRDIDAIEESGRDGQEQNERHHPADTASRASAGGSQKLGSAGTACFAQQIGDVHKRHKPEAEKAQNFLVPFVILIVPFVVRSAFVGQSSDSEALK
ncbi:MAG TPA: hypothetical protein VJX16_00780, partial [Terriglobales bacterium]|nr:hypothetical protein [Terriglobales bacterium]